MVYRLYAVVIHVGETVKYSHIFSYIRSPDNFWYKANDESIIQTNLDTVLADNNSYIFCYNKTTNANTIVREIQIDAFVEGTPHCLFSSTPIRPNETNYKTTHDDPIVGKTSILTCLSHLFCYIRSNFPLNISSFDNGSPMALDRADSHALKTHASTTKYSKLNFINVSNELVCLILDISYSSSSSEEDISLFKSQSLSEKIPEPIELQTESRIEIISNINHEHTSKHLNSYNKKRLLIVEIILSNSMHHTQM